MTERVWAILQREQALLEEQKRECAWCNEEQGIPQGEGSHGICDEHAEQLIENLHAARERKNK